jgi:hypothetical protein
MSKKTTRVRRKLKLKQIKEKYSNLYSMIERIGGSDIKIEEEFKRQRNRELTRVFNKRR